MNVWFITGASRGLGRQFAAAALARGDQVAATARTPSSLHHFAERYGTAFLPLQLDITDHAASVRALEDAHRHFGRLDVVVNNAGYTHFGFVEEVSESEVRAQFETDFFGTFWLTQAAVSLMRPQGSGHIVQISSTSGATAFPMTGLYSAAKWALEGMSEALAQEVAMFGINVTIVEPGAYATDARGASARHSEPLAAYDPIRQMIADSTQDLAVGDPEDAARALLSVVDADEPPLRLILGSFGYDLVVGVAKQRLETWQAWEALARGV